MRNYKIYILGLAVIAALIVSFYQSLPSFSLPVYPEAKEVKYHKDQPSKGVDSYTYLVEIPFPAKHLTGFIEGEIKKNGFKQFVGPFQAVQGAWFIKDEKTLDDVPTQEVPARYTAFWKNKTTDEIIWVHIMYSQLGGLEDWDKIAQVSIHLGNLTKFIEDAKAMGESS